MDIYSSHMRNRLITCTLAVCFLGECAAAQSAGWPAVQKIAPGTPISVKTHLRILCVFVEATADTLVCDVHRGGVIRTGRSTFTFNRNEVREVRLEHSDERNAAVGAVIGGSAGAALGASKTNGTLTRGGAALLLGGIGAIIGGGFGRDFPIFHGEVVYRK